MTRSFRNVPRWLVTLPILAVVLVPGCREEPRAEVLPLKGRVEKITLSSDEAGEISVTYYSDKHKQDVVGTGMVTKDTEILINGVVAKLKDIREGERISGEVRLEKKGDKRQQTVLRIVVDRPKPVGGGGSGAGG